MRETPSVTQRCTSDRRDGAPCTAQAGASGYCIGHDPGAVEARRKGGHATSRAERAGKLLPARLQPVVSLLEDALGEVHVGNWTPGPRRRWPAWPVPWCGPLRPANWKNDCGRLRTGAVGRLAREKSAVAWIHPSGGGPRLGLYGCIGHAANVVSGVRCTVGTLEDRGGGKVSP